MGTSEVKQKQLNPTTVLVPEKLIRINQNNNKKDNNHGGDDYYSGYTPVLTTSICIDLLRICFVAQKTTNRYVIHSILKSDQMKNGL